MPNEKGGRADKAGNRYEINWVIYQMLKVLDEVNYCIVLEALGEDEKGTDVLVITIDGKIDHQQCKGRNSSKEFWEIPDLKGKNIFTNWKCQLDRSNNRQVSLVSPISFSFLFDLCNRAINTNGIVYDFYNAQILSSSKEFKKFYLSYCKEMSLDVQIESDIQKSMDYLQRTHYRQISEYELQERINEKIRFLFSSPRNSVYNALVSLIIDGDIWGKEIKSSDLYAYISSQNLLFRSIEADDRIYPRLNELNNEYKELFRPLHNGFIERNEFSKCIEAIEAGMSIIIDGKAGNGKSGCTESIIQHCEKEKIPYLAIKLDKRIPHINCAQWGKDLGLPDSVSYCIHKISKNEKAVLILDQLDALRWTQVNSSESVSICMELICQVRNLNLDRVNKISVVFVCRTYDLENDNNIASLFKSKSEDEKDSWHRITVNNFDDETVSKIIGDRYTEFSKKLKELLRTPSNLYIYQCLDSDETYNDCITTGHLIRKWFKQICLKSASVSVDERIVIDTKNKIISFMDRVGRLYAPESILSSEQAGLDYLGYVGMIAVQDHKVSFVHQSMLDFFISEKMTELYFEEVEIINIIGDKLKQTPGRRYQIQIFLQNILEVSSEDFLKVGTKLLESCEIRYYVKYIFYELLAQIEKPDANIEKFISDNCENKEYEDYLLNNVIFSRKQYVSILRKIGILDKWYDNPSKKNIVINLFVSISPNYDIDDVAFLERHAFSSSEDDMSISRCFFYDINQDNDEMFELRMKFYQHYPEMAERAHIDLKSMLKLSEMRSIKLLSLWLDNKIKSKGRTLYKYEEELLDSNDDLFITHGEEVLDELIQYIPEGDRTYFRYGEWNAKYYHRCGLERTCVELIKKANVAVILQEPERFWNRYKGVMGKGHPVFNEIILHSLISMPEEYSDCVISYLCSDFNNNIFDLTSGAEDELGLVKQVITKHSRSCSTAAFIILQNSIYKYISPKAIDWYKNRIQYNREKKSAQVYWSFWGDLQKELLMCLPPEKLSEECRNLLPVLNRKFNSTKSIYFKYYGQGGAVNSPISGKVISENQWLKIITNSKIQKRSIANWKEVQGGIIESSLDLFSSDFTSVAGKNPEKMIRLALDNKDSVLEIFIDSLFNGVAFSDKLSNVPISLIEEMIITFPCDIESWRASSVCHIIEKRNDAVWSKEVIDTLTFIATKHTNPEIDKPNVTNANDRDMKSCNMLQSNAFNCVRGNAARAIGSILWENGELFDQFKDTIEVLVEDINPAVQYAALDALWPVSNINQIWAFEKILYLYEKDIRMASFYRSKNMFFALYPNYRERVLAIIDKCYRDQDDELISMGGYSISEMYIRNNEFEDAFNDIQSINKRQAEAILQMAVTYFNLADYNLKSKYIILKFREANIDVELPLSRLFHDKCIDLSRDKDFLLQIMGSVHNWRILDAFTDYLKENALSFIDFADIIIQLCENILQKDSTEIQGMWGVDDEISKLIISLYDETANSENSEYKQISNECLKLWDLMFEKQVGSVRKISKELMER